MAKRKKSRAVSMGPIGERGHQSVGIDDAENGYIVNHSGSGKNGEYYSRRYIAKDRPEALRISSSCLSGNGKGGKKKSGGKKKIALKKG